MARVLAAAALIALTLFAWDVPDCPFCGQVARYSAHSTDVDFFFLEPEEVPQLFVPTAQIAVVLEQPHSVDARRAPLSRAPKQGPPGA